MSTVLVEPYHTELIDGRELEKPLPKKLHWLIQSYLVVKLASMLDKRFQVGSEANVRCGEDRLIPDVIVVERNARYEDGDLAGPALLAIEILSTRQTIGALFDKAYRLLKAGTPCCWVIWPEKRQAWICTLDNLHEAVGSFRLPLEEGSVEINLAEMWAELD